MEFVLYPIVLGDRFTLLQEIQKTPDYQLKGFRVLKASQANLPGFAWFMPFFLTIITIMLIDFLNLSSPGNSS